MIDNLEEVWKVIPEWEGLYEVSSFGNVRSLDRYVTYYMPSLDKVQTAFKRGKSLSPDITHDGYLRVELKDKDRTCKSTVHRLVAKTFIENTDNKCCVNHKNGNKKDNAVLNLEWVSVQENTIHAFENKLIKFGTGLNRHSTKHIIEVYDSKTLEYVTTVCGIKEMKDFGLIPTHVYGYLKGKYKSHKGYIFKKINN